MSLTTEVEIDPEALQRQQIWDQLGNDLDRKVRNAGWEGIDDGIRNVVIGMNLLGIDTFMSCEGHDNYGEFSAPYASFYVFDKDPSERPRLKKFKSLVDDFNVTNPDGWYIMKFSVISSPFLVKVATADQKVPSNEEKAKTVASWPSHAQKDDYHTSDYWKRRELEERQSTVKSFSDFLENGYVSGEISLP